MDEELIELYYEVGEGIFDHMELAVCTLCFCLLCRGFFRKRKHSILPGIVWLCAMLIQYYIPVYMGGMVASAVSCFFSFLTMLFLTGEKERADSASEERLSAIIMERAPICFYLVAAFFSLQRLAGGIALELYLIISEKISHILIRHPDDMETDAWLPYFQTNCLELFFLLLIESLFLFVFVRLLNRAFYDKEGKYGWKEIGILLAPSIAGITLQLLRKSYDSLLLERTGESVFRISYIVGILLCLNYFALLCIHVIELYLYQNLRKKQEEEKRKSLLNSQMKDMQSHIAEMERIYTGIKGVRHDLNNHVHIVKSLLEQKQYEEAKQYLETLQTTVDIFDFPIKTGNPVTDVIVNEKYREAGQKEIDFTSDFYFVPERGVDAFDISIILNNALENAFEAARQSETPFVTLHSEQKKNAWLISMTNSCSVSLSFGGDGLPASHKEENGLHGLGLKNIRAVVEKYYGTFAIEQSDGEISVTVMLILG